MFTNEQSKYHLIIVKIIQYLLAYVKERNGFPAGILYFFAENTTKIGTDPAYPAAAARVKTSRLCPLSRGMRQDELFTFQGLMRCFFSSESSPEAFS